MKQAQESNMMSQRQLKISSDSLHKEFPVYLLESLNRHMIIIQQIRTDQVLSFLSTVMAAPQKCNSLQRK